MSLNLKRQSEIIPSNINYKYLNTYEEFSDRCNSSERWLLTAVLERAVRDLYSFEGGVRESAIRWFLDEKEYENSFSFGFIKEALNLGAIRVNSINIAVKKVLADGECMSEGQEGGTRTSSLP